MSTTPSERIRRYASAREVPPELYEEAVRLVSPGAALFEELEPLAYNRFGIHEDGRYLGGGPTEAVAWQNAWAHQESARIGQSRREAKIVD